LKTFKARETEFNNDPNYLNGFREKYENILNKAGLYFEMDNPLKANKDFVNALLQLDLDDPSKFNREEREQLLGKLHGADLPDNEKDNPLMQQRETKIAELEAFHFRICFRDKVNQMAASNMEQSSLLVRNELSEEIKNTSCKYCRQMVSGALDDFDLRFAEVQKQEALEQNNTLLFQVKEVVYEALKKQHSLETWFNKNYNDSVVPPPHIAMLKKFMDELTVKRQILEEFAKLNFHELDLSTLTEYNQNLTELIKSLETGYLVLCEKLPEACEE
jgi:hypothetical protein